MDNIYDGGGDDDNNNKVRFTPFQSTRLPFRLGFSFSLVLAIGVEAQRATRGSRAQQWTFGLPSLQVAADGLLRVALAFRGTVPSITMMTTTGATNARIPL